MSGRLLIVTALLSWGFWAFALRKAVVHLEPLMAQIVYVLAMLLAVPLYFLLARRWDVPFKVNTPGAAWATAAALAVGVGGVSLLYAMRARDTSQAVALTAAYPVVTMALAVLFLGEQLSLTRGAGVVAIALGAWLVSRT